MLAWAVRVCECERERRERGRGKITYEKFSKCWQILLPVNTCDMNYDSVISQHEKWWWCVGTSTLLDKRTHTIAKSAFNFRQFDGKTERQWETVRKRKREREWKPKICLLIPTPTISITTHRVESPPLLPPAYSTQPYSLYIFHSSGGSNQLK